jgi:hypothetical protein
MKSIVERLESLSTRKRIVQSAKKEMNGGETWVCAVQLDKGVEYSIMTTGSGAAANIRSSLFNGGEKPVCESDQQGINDLLVVPEENGLYKLMIVSEPTGNDSKPGRVAVTVRREYVPCRVRPWLSL